MKKYKTETAGAINQQSVVVKLIDDFGTSVQEVSRIYNSIESLTKNKANKEETNFCRKVVCDIDNIKYGKRYNDETENKLKELNFLNKEGDIDPLVVFITLYSVSIKDGVPTMKEHNPIGEELSLSGWHIESTNSEM